MTIPLVACRGPAPDAERSSLSPSLAPSPVPTDPVAIDAGVGISEVRARLQLDAMFRDAGYRMLNDEPLENSLIEVVLDGYDPQQEVGYEYISVGETKESITIAQSDELAKTRRILILRTCSQEALRRRASEFLERAIAAPDAGSR